MSQFFTQLTTEDDLVIIQRNWTKEERERFERLYSAQIASNMNILPYSAMKKAFAQMVLLDNLYTHTQTTDNE